ncbi:MAG: TonB family protein [Gammaproteobacteria bacterium]|nr:TonB family protein [Gammaproteobacteria bacterium]
MNADSELLRLLHRAIDRYKRYPRSTRLMGGEGTAVVDFRLSSDGTVSALRVDHSSGFDALDAAALTAVRSIAPFSPAAEYLHAPRRFQVRIVFRLRH